MCTNSDLCEMIAQHILNEDSVTVNPTVLMNACTANSADHGTISSLAIFVSPPVLMLLLLNRHFTVNHLFEHGFDPLMHVCFSHRILHEHPELDNIKLFKQWQLKKLKFLVTHPDIDLTATRVCHEKKPAIIFNALIYCYCYHWWDGFAVLVTRAIQSGCIAVMLKLVYKETTQGLCMHAPSAYGQNQQHAGKLMSSLILNMEVLDFKRYCGAKHIVKEFSKRLPSVDKDKKTKMREESRHCRKI